ADSELKEAVNQLEARQAAADLGGNVYKVRIPRHGGGKSGGFRVIVLFKSEERAFFVYGFAKSDKGNIKQDELRAFKHRAKDVFSMSEEQIKERTMRGTLTEVF
ncbi:MAG: type II toxin-antitoxin system RelE/ParE family toxin, partial [Spirochaetes bacterium]|nr:type II toxin-antitoxin system RelE/ParE family toxin [Spirochaetota bacterium]